MAGLLPSFASGSNLALYLGNLRVAYGSNLTFTDDVAHAAVGGIGSYSYDALEPTQYLARGSFSIVRYGSVAGEAIVSKTAGTSGKTPTKMGSTSVTTNPDTDGNSMLHPSQFNPTGLLLSKSFDIKVFERQVSDNSQMRQIFTLQDCRMTGYSIGFTPGSLVTENISFICILAKDHLAQGG